MGGLTEATVDTLITLNSITTNAVVQQPALMQRNHGLFADLDLTEVNRTPSVASVLMGHRSGMPDSDYTPKI